MDRRSVLSSIGTLAAIGFGSHLIGQSDRQISIKLWMTEEAADYSGCQSRAMSYLKRAFHRTGREIQLTVAETPQRFTVTDRAIEQIAWPKRVLSGLSGISPLNPVSDVNLLITNGDVTGDIAGYAYPHVATVPGAKFLAKMPSIQSIEGVVNYTVPAAITQLLLHEVGHALGLGHCHGSITTNGSVLTVSPMISGYAWAHEPIQCLRTGGKSLEGDAPGPVPKNRRLRLEYSKRSEAAIRSYRDGLSV